MPRPLADNMSSASFKRGAFPKESQVYTNGVGVSGVGRVIGW